MMGMDGGRRLLERDAIKAQNLGATLRRFGSYFRPYGALLLVVVILVGLSAWTQVILPDFTQVAVDCYLNPAKGCTDTSLVRDTTTGIPQLTDEQRFSGVTSVVIQVVMIMLLNALVNGIAFFLMAYAGQNVLRQLRIEVMEQVHRLSLGYYTENEAGDIMSRVTSDTDTISQVMGFGLLSVGSAIVLLIWIVIKMLEKNIAYALLTLAVVPAMAITTVWLSTQARRAFRRSRAEMGSVNADLQESIAGVREVQAFNREGENIKNFEKTNAANRDISIRAVSYSAALSPALEALSYVALAIVACVGGIALLRPNSDFAKLFGETVTIGLVFAFLQYAQRFSQPIQQIALLWTNIQSAIAGGERIFGLLDVKPEIIDSPNARPMPEIKGNVEFDAVWAEYKKGQPVLKGVSLSAKPGQTIAIVGPTGAGKTTIINLLPRFWDVTGGSVKIDGMDVREVTAKSLRSQIGIVLQDSFLFSDTIMNNIRYGRPDATDEEVIAAAKLASADTFIERLPEKYQTLLGERGGGLSQGQRQLLSIARAALANPRILILDEATSSVDTRTERLIQKALENLLEGRTSFVIAHRLSTIRSADQVLMLKAGEIIERGTHNELLEMRGAYFDLYMSQFRREGGENAPDQSVSMGIAAPSRVVPGLS
jgi:ATP-binding cassette subfamily B protein